MVFIALKMKPSERILVHELAKVCRTELLVFSDICRKSSGLGVHHLLKCLDQSMHADISCSRVAQFYIDHGV